MHINDRDVLTILRSLGVNLPIINSCGCRPTKPIALVTDESNISWIKRNLTNFDGTVVGEDMKLTAVSRLLRMTNSEFVIFPYSKTRKSQERMAFLVDCMTMGVAGGREINALPLIISTERLQEKDVEMCFIIYLDEDISGIYISSEEVIPPDDKVEVVLDKISGLDMQGKSQQEKALLAAACFTYPFLKEKGCADQLERFLSTASKLAELDDENHDVSGLGAMFVSELYSWQERTGFSEIYALPQIGMMVEQRFAEVMLYDGRYIYMQEALFKAISEPLLRLFSENVLKGELVNCGMLCPENSRTFTAKAGYLNIAGEYRRIRALRFEREKLNRLGELNFLDLCLEGEEK